MPQQMWRDPFSLPNFARPRLLEPCFLCGFIQQPLDLPGGDMTLVSALEDVSVISAQNISTQGIQNGLGKYGGALFITLAFHDVQISSGAI